MKKLFLFFLPMLFVACADPEMPKPGFGGLDGYNWKSYDYQFKGIESIVFPYYIDGYLSAVYPNVPVSFEAECDASWIKVLNVVADEDNRDVVVSYDILNWNIGQQSRSATITITELNSKRRKNITIEQGYADYYREAHYYYCTSNGNKYTITLSNNGWADDGSTKADSWYARVTFFSEVYSAVRDNTKLENLPDGIYTQSYDENYGTGYMIYTTTNSSNKATNYDYSVIYSFEKDGSKISLAFKARIGSGYSYNYYDYLITY